jgi:hypothetical protein
MSGEGEEKPEVPPGTGAKAGETGELDLTESEAGADVEEWRTKQKLEVYDPVKAREGMRGQLAGGLIVLLAFVVVASFVTVWVRGNLTEPTKDLLGLILGPVVTLVGSATGFYFGGREGGGGGSGEPG